MKTYFSPIVIITLAVLIIGKPLFEPGVINLLDGIFVPHRTLDFSESLIFLLPQIGSLVIGAGFMSKLYLLLVLTLAGALGVAFARLIEAYHPTKHPLFLELFGIMFCMMNPFAYERLLTQPRIYLGVILLGWGVWSLGRIVGAQYFVPDSSGKLTPRLWSVNLTPQPPLLAGGGGVEQATETETESSPLSCEVRYAQRHIEWAVARVRFTERTCIWLAFGLALSAFPHAAYMIALILGMYVILFVRTKKAIFHLLWMVAIIIVINLNWLLAGAWWGGHESLADAGSFNDANLQAFLTRAVEPVNTTFTNLFLYGFWGGRQYTIAPTMLSPFWYMAGGLLLLTMVWSLVAMLKSRNYRRHGIILLVIAVISLIFGLGIATHWTRPIMDLAYEYLPLFRGYREPQKWIGLLMIVEGILFLVALNGLPHKIRDNFYRYGGAGFLIVLLVLWSPGMLFGFRGQLTTMQYPASFEVARTSLLEEENVGKILILPWHSYMGCDWTNKRIITNPLKAYFSPLDVTIADNIEMRGLYTNSRNPESAIIETFLKVQNIFQPLADLGYTHIFVAKNCGNNESFEWLSTTEACTKTATAQEYEVWRCKK